MNFDILEQTLADNDLEDKPCQIFNINETGMPLDPKSVRGIFAKRRESCWLLFRRQSCR